jgi:cholesterol oxidase
MDAPLAHPISDLQDSYGVVVIGSGYGGAIVAARLAQGRSLCILERGREWIPGTFPDAFDEIVKAVRSPKHPLGLYDYHIHREVDVFVGSGLGGTSLVNANVVIEPDSDLFDHPRWPVEIRQDRAAGTLQGYLAAVRQMLQIETYGDDLPALRKLDAHRKSSLARGANFSYLDVAVNFRRYADQPNHVGVHQRLCTLCGDCITGCNVRAKNTLYMNYLPLAKQHGAQIFTQVEVDHVVKLSDGGYVVHYTYHPDNGQASREGIVRASVVILAAGALGSAEILLRSREAGLSCSEALGHYFSGNGAFLGAAYNTDQQTDILGFGNIQDERAQIRVGPTILSMADYRARTTLAERFILEEGAIPRGLVDTLRKTIHILNFTKGEDTDAGLIDYIAESQRIGRDLVHYDPQGALNHSMIYLGVGHDSADGTLVLDQHGHVQLLWGNAPDQPLFHTLSGEMRAHTAALGGTYIANPRWHRSLGRNLITVHPLGGCIMASNGAKGVVDHRGRVYDPSRGLNDTHTGLFVADGSIIPTAVGVNPLLTISALGERIAALINTDATLDMAPKPLNRPTYVVVRPPVGLHFTEEMKGYFTEGIQGERLEDYREGERRGRDSGNRLSVWLWIAIENLELFLSIPEHEALVSGYVDYAPVGGKRSIDRGRFNLFVATPQPHTKNMRYSLQFTGSDGHPYLLAGFKEIRDDRGWDAWSDNTTLFTTIHRGTTPSDPVVGRGVTHVLIWDLVEQVASFRVHNAPTAPAALLALNRFGGFFFGDLWETYLKHRVPEI